MRVRTLAMGFVLITTVACLFLLAWLCGTVCPAEDDIVRTLVHGLRARGQNVRTLQGVATAASLYDPESLAALRASSGSAPQELEYSLRGLQRIAFWIDFANDKWRVEVAELISTGFNEWGFLTNYAMQQAQSRTPVLLETCDGSTITRWDMLFARAEVIQFDPRLPSGGGYVRARLERYLLLGWPGLRPEDYSFAGIEKMAGADCHKLVRRQDDDKYYGRSTLWIATGRGFAVLRRVALSVYKDEPKRGSREEVIGSSLVRLADGIWLPTETRINSYAYVPEKNSAMCESHVLYLSDLKLNAPIPEFYFHAPLPLGTIARDEGGVKLVGHTEATRQRFEHEPPSPQYEQEYCRALRGDEFDSK